MKFTKHRNPSKKRIRRSGNPALQTQLQKLLAQAKSETERQYILQAYIITRR